MEPPLHMEQPPATNEQPPNGDHIGPPSPTNRDRDDRERGRASPRDRGRDRDRGRRRDGDRDRDRHRRRSGSGERDRRGRRRSRSRSRDRRSRKHRRKRSGSSGSSPSPPPAAGATNPLAALPAGMPNLVEIMKANPTMSVTELMSKMSAGTLGVPGAPLALGGADSKPARELYVGGLPPGTQPAQLQEYLAQAMVQMGLATQPGNPVVSIWLSSENNFAFCEFRSIEEANNGMSLNGAPFMGGALKVGRPKNYTGPAITPIPGMIPGMPPVGAKSDMLMIRNLPPYLNGAQTKELLSPFGELEGFNLMRDEAGTSLGTALFSYKDKANMDTALEGLNGLALGDAKLKVTYAPATPGLTLPPADAPEPEFGAAALKAEGGEEKPSCVIRLDNMISEGREELTDTEEYADLLEDVREELEKFGTVKSLQIPRPGGDDAIVGHIYVRYGAEEQAGAAQKAMANRTFGDNKVECTFVEVAEFEKLFPAPAPAPAPAPTPTPTPAHATVPAVVPAAAPPASADDDMD